MKKCPFCAEEIQDEAVKCRYCKRTVSSLPTLPTPATNQLNKSAQKDSTSLWGFILLALIGSAIVLAFWETLLHLAISGIGIWFIWAKTKMATKNKVGITAVLAIIAVSITASIQYTTRTPVLTIESPKNNYSTQADTITIKGSVNPQNSTVVIQNTAIPVKDGQFEYEAKLTDEQNEIEVTADNSKNANHSTTQTLTITRILTPEEKAKAEAEKQAALDAENKATAVTKQQELAEQKKWDQSKAGQICKKHTGWSREDCKNIAGNKYWIGMDLAMLKAERGNPNSANPSNYGGDTQWQWCWEDGYKPSCFYGGDDEIITSYN